MTDSTLTPSQEAREAVLSSGFPLAREGREAIENREWEHHYLLQAFARFEQSIRRDEAEKCARAADGYIEGLEPPQCWAVGWKNGFEMGAADASAAIAAALRARHDGGGE